MQIEGAIFKNIYLYTDMYIVIINAKRGHEFKKSKKRYMADEVWKKKIKG